MSATDVLIVGAGPTGLVLALWLNRLGVAVRIVDHSVEPGTTSRALAVQARTLELYRQLDLAEPVIQRGHHVRAGNLWVAGEPAARFSFDAIASNLTPYSFLHIFPQDEHERLLLDRLAQAGVTVERQTEFVEFVDEGTQIVARLRGPDGAESTCVAGYIAGCDGARSKVRETIGTGYAGGTYRQLFYVADVAAAGPTIDGELHVDLDEADFLAVFPLAGGGRARLIGAVRDERADRAETLTFADVSDRAITNLKVRVAEVNWFSTYHVHHRVTSHFRLRRAFLLGDAAHTHSPVGGQGMNTGIGDAINLAWKLAAVLGGRAPDALLDSYETERIGFARRLVATTDHVFTLATADGALADLLRTRVAPILIPTVARFGGAREFLFRTVSQITLNYRGLALSEGSAGAVHGGDRLPWVAAARLDNYAPLADPVWQAHVYGTPAPALIAACAEQRLPLHVFDWQPPCASAGLTRNALYLLRPDTYVALVDPAGDPGAIVRYATARGLRGW